MKRKLFGALVLLGVDGAGLPSLPDTLPEVRNPLDLPLFQGSEEQLNAVAEQTAQSLRAAGAVVGPVTISSRHRRFWVRPTWHALLTADCYDGQVQS